MISIETAILGLLSLKPMTGYDIKKLIAESDVLYWSGNNNQIYTSLVKLHQKDLVSQEIELRADSPSRKIYSLTQKGRDELKTMLLSDPELPQLTRPFLIQLAWADQLDQDTLDSLLLKYEEEIEAQLAILKVRSGNTNYKQHGKMAGEPINPTHARTEREAVLWQKIQDNRIAFFQHELDWIRDLRRELLN